MGLSCPYFHIRQSFTDGLGCSLNILLVHLYTNIGGTIALDVHQERNGLCVLLLPRPLHGGSVGIGLAAPVYG